MQNGAGEFQPSATPDEIVRLLGEVQAELVVTQAALALALANLARLTEDPHDYMATQAVRILGLGQSASDGMTSGAIRPEVGTACAERIAGWAEALIPARRT